MTERKQKPQLQQLYQVDREIVTLAALDGPEELRYEEGRVVAASDFPQHVRLEDLIACGALSIVSGPQDEPQAPAAPAEADTAAGPVAGGPE